MASSPNNIFKNTKNQVCDPRVLEKYSVKIRIYYTEVLEKYSLKIRIYYMEVLEKYLLKIHVVGIEGR